MERGTDLDGEKAFAGVFAAFQAALESCPHLVQRHACSFAGREALIRIVGLKCAERLLPPFRHLIDSGGAPSTAELVIDVWDAGETGMAYSGPVVAPDLMWSEFGFILGEESDRFVGSLRPNLFAWSDRSAGRIVACTPDSGLLALNERAKPLLFPLLLWHGDRDAEVIHAGLVERDGQGVLFGGREGAGKSTAALACLEAGFSYLGDDYIGLRTADHGFLGYSLYNSAWLEPTHASLFPSIKGRMIDGRQKKLPVVLSEIRPDRLGRVASIRAIVLPQMAESASCVIVPASKREAFLALAPTSLVKRPFSRQSGMDKLGRLVESVPAYRLRFGNDLKEVAARIDEVLGLKYGERLRA
ncbi:MAG TPA: hypothetical protein VMO47_18310 [Rhodothermales bacterium]|nr:hypothetical protein [Rhodothermales bacterium]